MKLIRNGELIELSEKEIYQAHMEYQTEYAMGYIDEHLEDYVDGLPMTAQQLRNIPGFLVKAAFLLQDNEYFDSNTIDEIMTTCVTNAYLSISTGGKHPAFVSYAADSYGCYSEERIKEFYTEKVDRKEYPDCERWKYDVLKSGVFMRAEDAERKYGVYRNHKIFKEEETVYYEDKRRKKDA